MKNVFYLILINFFLSCSTETTEDKHFKISVDNATVDYLAKPEYGIASIGVSDIGISVSVHLQDIYNGYLNLGFNREGKLLGARLYFNGYGDGDYEYKNFRHYRSNYFNASIIKLDEKTKTIWFKFNGKLYADDNNLNSYYREVSGDIKANYDYGVSTNPYPSIKINGIEQYCRAKFNDKNWYARFEYESSVFTAEDPYKIKIHVGLTSAPNTNFTFENTSSSNYVKFYKFNTQTLTYDEFIVSGNMAYSYREFHGGNDYSHIGTFNLTATNPNNPSDVINITDGVFRNYQ